MPQPQQRACLTEGVFVTSKKRMYNEYVFDLRNDEDGKTCNRKPGRRGPLTESTRQSIESVKLEGGACWRCKMLKKPCDGESPCTQCAKMNGKLWQLGCQRGNLQGRLKDKFRSLPGFGSSEWFLPTGEGFTLRIRMKYDQPNFEIHDHGLSSYLTAPQPQSKDSLVKFLKQFHDINSRWGNHYGPVTEDVVTLCAEIQEDALSRTSRIPANSPEEILLIALSLRTLAFAHNFDLVQGNLPPHPETRFLQPKMIRAKNPSLEAWKCDPAAESKAACLGHDGGRQFSSMIEEIVRITQHLLFRRRPTDWPYLFCVLCLLRLIIDEISFSLFDTFNRACDALESVWSMLCQLYHVCTKGNHPLSHDWSVEEYTSLVENDTLAIDHFRVLNDTWVEGWWKSDYDDDDDDDDDDFKAKLRRFVPGNNEAF